AFVADNGGNPNKTNGDDANALHLVCQIGRRNRNIECKVRAECLSFLLTWQGVVLANGLVERANMNALDSKKNTPLHYAAAHGMKQCVEILVNKNVNIFLENENKETACDLAIKAGHADVGEYLESRMLFSAETTEDINEEEIFPVFEAFSGLREQDLREAKDLLLVETADMLHIPLFTAETLLKHHEWSREALIEAWMRDPSSCCEKCGVHYNQSMFNKRNSNRSRTSIPSGSVAIDITSVSGSPNMADHEYLKYEDDPFDCSASLSMESERSEEHEICGICAENILYSDTVGTTECSHRFCKSCWKSYICVRLQDGESHGINCPAFDCNKLVPLELIELVLSPTMARKFLKFDIKAFVESNPRMKWCPYPGCTNAIRLPDLNQQQTPVYLRAFPKIQPPPPSSRSVTCPNGHAFCWDCLAEGHEPTSCDKWKEWHDKIAEIKPEELKDTSTSSEMAANCLWLVTNSKPCPKCKSPIQKNDGCNHMKCSKCKHDFCWVCLGPWKKHSTETGGYFRCNRYDDSRKIDEKTEQAIAEAKEQSKKTYELNRFVHYYSRYKNHLNSFEVMEIEKSQSSDFSFVKDSISELLRSRKVLSSSYAYGYFLKDCGYNKTIFEYLQNELEVSVEALSGLVGRQYLRGSKLRIVQTTQMVAGRRYRFLLCIMRGLLPPETPPGLRKNRKRGLPAILGLDKDEYNDSGATDAALRFACGQSVAVGTSSSARRKYNVDLMIALQMSRLQLLQELKTLSRDQNDSETSRTSRFSVDDQLDEDDEDADLQLAIERSVLDITHCSAPNLSFESPCCSTHDPIGSVTDNVGKFRSNYLGGLSEDNAQAEQNDDINPRIIDSYFRNMVSKKSASSINDDVNLLKNDAGTPDAKMDKVSKALIKTEFGGGTGTKSSSSSLSIIVDESATKNDEFSL
uniref:RBR-type E3 ubiquitin transferase n=1 Tax=Romanomermis culicivorax TaxID=13658 RepID=A0A915J9D8_ROMCU